MKPMKCPTKEKDQAEGKNAKKKRDGGKREKSKSSPKILISAHDRSYEADIMHLEQKAAKCTNCQPLFGEI